MGVRDGCVKGGGCLDPAHHQLLPDPVQPVGQDGDYEGRSHPVQTAGLQIGYANFH